MPIHAYIHIRTHSHTIASIKMRCHGNVMLQQSYHQMSYQWLSRIMRTPKISLRDANEWNACSCSCVCLRSDLHMSRCVRKGKRNSVWPKMQKCVKWMRNKWWQGTLWAFHSVSILCELIRSYFLIHASVPNNLIASNLFWSTEITTTSTSSIHTYVHIRQFGVLCAHVKRSLKFILFRMRYASHRTVQYYQWLLQPEPFL